MCWTTQAQPGLMAPGDKAGAPGTHGDLRMESWQSRTGNPGDQANHKLSAQLLIEECIFKGFEQILRGVTR